MPYVHNVQYAVKKRSVHYIVCILYILSTAKTTYLVVLVQIQPQNEKLKTSTQATKQRGTWKASAFFSKKILTNNISLFPFTNVHWYFFCYHYGRQWENIFKMDALKHVIVATCIYTWAWLWLNFTLKSTLVWRVLTDIETQTSDTLQLEIVWWHCGSCAFTDVMSSLCLHGTVENRGCGGHHA